MKWFLSCENPLIPPSPLFFPFTIGRTGCNLNFQDQTVSRVQCHLELRKGALFLVNESMDNPTVVDGQAVAGALPLAITAPHRIEAGTTVFAIAANQGVPLGSDILRPAETRYFYQTNGQTYGPLNEAQLVDAVEMGSCVRTSTIWEEGKPHDVHPATDYIDFGSEPAAPETPSWGDVASSPGSVRGETAEEKPVELGVNFMCPYCRTVSNLEDVLSVSVSPALANDPVLGFGAQQRFLPSRFTGNGLAIDSEGGICTEIACPHCHMALPQSLLDTPQTVMSVVGAPASGKSFFLASAIWQCRQVLSRRFGVSFMDLDPVSNRWINEYEEKLFFESGNDELQKIEKTDTGDSAVLKTVTLDGAQVQLSLPSFFKLRSGGSPESSLVVYDSAGEHFRAGADSSHSLVTLNILGSDVLYFLYDPSADPRFRAFLNRGSGTASQLAQRQDTLLTEMSARIQRHLGNRREAQLSRPLIFGVSKADMLRKELPLDKSPYRELPADAVGRVRYALDFDALRDISSATEEFLNGLAPEAVATAHDIAKEVWFLPMSALGHNPAAEGVRPSDVQPIWAELPVVFTLACKGLVATVGKRHL